MRTCPNCGETFDDFTNYCLKDGTPLNTSFPLGNLAPQGFQSPHRRKPQYSPFVVAVGITLALLGGICVIGIGAIVVLRGTSNVTPGTPPYGSNSTLPVNGSTNANKSVEPPQFAREVFRFGSEGIGAGQFQSIRSIAVDAEGKIYVGEGERPARVQVFDASGKFLTQWTAPDKEAYLTKLAADRNGAVYAIQGFGLVRLDGATGKQTAVIVKPRYGTFNHDDPLEFIADDVAVALDNSVWVLVGGGTFLHFDSNGKLLGKVKNAAKLASYDSKFKQITVDGTGNIYALSHNECYIFKFSSEGKFLNRFGSSRKSGSPGNSQSGQCSISFNDIAVDGKGRVFVSDSWSGVSVFDGDGKVVGSFKGKDIISNMVFTDKNQFWASAGKGVAKFEINQ